MVSYLKRLKEGIEIDENNLGNVILARVDKEEHVGDAKQRQENQRGLDCLPVGREQKTSDHREEQLCWEWKGGAWKE